MKKKIKFDSKGILYLAMLIGVIAFVFYWRLGTEKNPGDYAVTKGNYRLEDGQFDEAAKEFSIALEKNPDHAMAHLGLAITYMQMNKNQESMAEFNRAIELGPDLAPAYADRGVLYDRMGEYEKALADYRKALAMDPKILEGPGFLWRFMRNIEEMPPTILQRADYLEAELAKPPEERLLKVPEIDKEQRMYKIDD
ncbi:MAG: tetratricopeptide repeat protein [Proteobacteria bacterium]|nr:tetratricopeptide repeat protein [Pseudomonadota bacterium]